MPLFDGRCLNIKQHLKIIIRIPESYFFVVWTTDINFSYFLIHNLPIYGSHCQFMPFEMMNHLIFFPVQIASIHFLWLVLATWNNIELFLVFGDRQRPDLCVVLHRAEKLAILFRFIVNRMVSFVLSEQGHSFCLKNKHFAVRRTDEEFLLYCSDYIGSMFDVVDHLCLRFTKFPPIDASTNASNHQVVGVLAPGYGSYGKTYEYREKRIRVFTFAVCSKNEERTSEVSHSKEVTWFVKGYATVCDVKNRLFYSLFRLVAVEVQTGLR